MVGGNERDGASHDEAYRRPARDSDPPEDRDERLHQRGKMWVALMLGVQGVFLLVTLIEVGSAYRAHARAPSLHGLTASLGQPLVGFSMISGLLFAVYQGRSWARTALVVLLGPMAVFMGVLVGSDPLAFFRGTDSWQLARLGDMLWMLGMFLAAPSIRALIGRGATNRAAP